MQKMCIIFFKNNNIMKYAGPSFSYAIFSDDYDQRFIVSKQMQYTGSVFTNQS